MAFIKYTSGNVTLVKEHICCACESDEHQINFRYFENTKEGDDYVYMTIHLNPKHNVFKRIIKSIKYIFRYRSKYGDFDEVILDKERCLKIINFLEKSVK